MKSIFLVLCCLLGWQNPLAGQGCLPTGITFHTQAEIDQFPTNYPGCSQITGNVMITGDDITNLDSLNSLQSVGASLFIHFCPKLISLKGLANLQAIGNIGPTKSLIINTNAQLKNLDGLENLKKIDGYLDISDNPKLEQLDALAQLRSVGNNFYLQRNTALQHLKGLKSLQLVGKDLLIEESPLLQNLIGLDSLASIGGSFYVQFNDHLNSLAGLCPNLRIWQYLVLSLNYELTDCAIEPICRFLGATPGNFLECSNGPGCAAPAEIMNQCQLLGGATQDTPMVKVWPNPFKDYLSFSSATHHDLKIYDLFGQVYYSNTTNSPERLETTHWPAGCYVVEILEDGHRQVFKYTKIQ